MSYAVTEQIAVIAAVLTLAVSAWAQCPPVPPVTVGGVTSPPAIPGLRALSPYQTQFNVDPIVAGQSGFYAERSPNTEIFQLINRGYPMGQFLDDERLEPGRIFCYRTRAFNDCGGNSGETPEVMITMPPGPAPYKFAPPTPANMSAESVSGHAVYHVTAGPFPGVSGTYNGRDYNQNQVIQYVKSTDGINWVGLYVQSLPPAFRPIARLSRIRLHHLVTPTITAPAPSTASDGRRDLPATVTFMTPRAERLGQMWLRSLCSK